jgi:hypothetical protein
MTQKMPPIPPENRSPKGPGSDPAVSAESPIDKKLPTAPAILKSRAVRATSSRTQPIKATSRIGDHVYI